MPNNLTFYLWKCLEITVGELRGSIAKTFYNSISTDYQHIKKIIFDFVRCSRVLDRSGHGTKSCFMKYIFNPFGGIPTIFQITNITDLENKCFEKFLQ